MKLIKNTVILFILICMTGSLYARERDRERDRDRDLHKVSQAYRNRNRDRAAQLQNHPQNHGQFHLEKDEKHFNFSNGKSKFQPFTIV